LLKRFGVEAGNIFKPAAVDGLFTRKELATRESLFTALQKRFLQGELKPERARALREYMNGMNELGPNEVRDSIRLLMSTPDYQVV
ncbi:MAG TPA: hypothetical protein VK970_25320, partial [Candidatus Methylacidiphilales bacterium]|nr:hypothetical protein [Candidatus Methylacidiphilales bacterium]